MAEAKEFQSEPVQRFVEVVMSEHEALLLAVLAGHVAEYGFGAGVELFNLLQVPAKALGHDGWAEAERRGFKMSVTDDAIYVKESPAC